MPGSAAPSPRGVLGKSVAANVCPDLLQGINYFFIPLADYLSSLTIVYFIIVNGQEVRSSMSAFDRPD